MELSASQAVYLTNLPVWFKYNEKVFDPNVSYYTTVTLTFANTQDYLNPDSNKNDVSSNEMNFIISLDYRKTKVTTVLINTTFQKYAHVSMPVFNCTETPNVAISSTQNMLNVAMYATEANVPFMGNTDYFTNLTSSNFTFNEYCAPTIKDFYPKVSTAGTGSVLTVQGTGFGNSPGQLKFINANRPEGKKQAVSANTSDILKWTDTEVQYILHSRAKDTSCVGTGPFSLFSASGDSANSNTDLMVEYAVFNYTYGSKQYPSFSVMPYETNDGNAREFHLLNDPDFPEAKAVIMKAIRDITCNTGVNFTYDTVNRDASYFVDSNRFSVIVMGYDDYLKKNSTTLAYTKNFVEKTLCGEASGRPWSINYESDIMINNTRKWNFDTTGSGIPEGEYPFYEVILHELGHAAGLDHVCTQKYQLMYPSTDNNGRISSKRYYLGKYTDETVNQGIDWMFAEANKINFGGSDCSNNYRMQRSACFKEVGLEDQTFFESIQLYNNPTADGTVSLRFKLLKPELVSFKLVDLMGRTLQEQQKDYTTTEVDEALDLGKQPTGVYGLIVQKGKDVQMFKIVKQ